MPFYTAPPVASQVPVTPSGNLTSINTQLALQELQSEIDSLGGGWSPLVNGVLNAGNRYVDTAAAYTNTLSMSVGSSLRLADPRGLVSGVNSVTIGTGADTFDGVAGPLVLTSQFDLTVICKAANTFVVTDSPATTSASPITDWVTATAYSVGQYVNESNKLYKCLVAHTSGVFATDAANWVEVSADILQITDWVTATAYSVGQLVLESDRIYRCAVAHTSTVFATDAANWVEVSASVPATAQITDWVTATAYSVGQFVVESNRLYRCTVAHTSGVFATDAANWVEVSADILQITDWVTTTAYSVGQLVLESDRIYRCTVAHTSGVFATDAANWVEVSASVPATAQITDWATATAYSVGQFVVESNKIYRCTVGHTSTVFATDSANWVEISSADTDWLFTTNNINVVVGKSYIVDGAHTINLPAAANGDSIRFATPVEWSTRGATWVAPGATTIASGQVLPSGFDVAEFIYNSTSDNWVVNLGGATPVGDTIQNLNATGTVAAWDSVVRIGSTPLTANATITLPSASGNSGKTIKFIREDNTAFTVTLAAPGAESVTLKNSGTELNSQNGSLTIVAVSSTESRQAASVSTSSSVTVIDDDTFATATSTNVPSAESVKAYVDASTSTPAPAGSYGGVGKIDKRFISIYPASAAPLYLANGLTPVIIGTVSTNVFQIGNQFATAPTLATKFLRTTWQFTAGLVNGLRGDSTPFSMQSGFSLRMRFSIEQGWANIPRGIFGMLGSNPSANSDPSTSVTEFVALGFDAADTNMQLMIRGAAGAAQKINLGATMPKPTSAQGNNEVVFDLSLSVPPGAGIGSTLTYTVTRVDLGVTVQGTATLTASPTSTAPLGPQINLIGPSAAGRRFGLMGIEAEANY